MNPAPPRPGRLVAIEGNRYRVMKVHPVESHGLVVTLRDDDGAFHVAVAEPDATGERYGVRVPPISLEDVPAIARLALARKARGLPVTTSINVLAAAALALSDAVADAGAREAREAAP